MNGEQATPIAWTTPRRPSRSMTMKVGTVTRNRTKQVWPPRRRPRRMRSRSAGDGSTRGPGSPRPRCSPEAGGCRHPRPSPSRSRPSWRRRSEEHTSELQSHVNLVCRLLLEKKKKIIRKLYKEKKKENNNKKK